MDKRFWVIIGILIVGFFGFLLLQGDDEQNTSTTSNAQATNHTKGEGASGVTLVEYGDFQCPACGAYYPLIEQVYDKYQDQITFQFRHFPLTAIHQNAFAASRAAEAASKQGKFWEMYDQLYTNQQAWSGSSSPNGLFESYAKAIGLNIDQYKKDFPSRTVNDAIRADLAAGEKLKVNSTPTFFLDGEKIESPPQNLDGFSKLIDEAIAKKSGNDQTN